MMAFSTAMVVEAARAIVFFRFGVIILCLLLLFVSLLVRVISKLKSNQELIITIFFTVLYFGSLLVYYWGNGEYFTNVFDSFYFAYTSALFERLIATRIPKPGYRTAFSISTTFLRLLIIPTNDNGMLVIQFVALIASIYFDHDKECHDQNLFKSYFYSKEELLKFKNLVVQDIPEGILIVDYNLTKFLFMNNPITEQLGIQLNSNIEDQLLKFHLQKTPETSVIDSPQNLLEYLVNLTQEGQQKISSNIRNIEFQRDNNRDKSHLFEAKILGLTWDEQQAIAIILHDINQQQTIFNLKAANANKDAILATISHELRTPLNGMLGMIQIMQKQVIDNQMARYLDICKNNGHLLLSLVNSILDLNQIRANRLKLYPERINLLEFLRDVTALFEFQCTQKGIYLKLDTSSCSQQFIITDRNRLSQILINLIGNALKFTMEGGITVSVSDHSDKDYVKFSVEDTGCGIKEQDKQKLFQMYGKLEHENRSINKQGVGLGLTISNDLAKFLCFNEEIEGINVESEYNKGSNFTFLIKKDLQASLNKGQLELNQRTNSTNPSLVYFEDVETRLESYQTLPLKKPTSFQSLCSLPSENQEKFPVNNSQSQLRELALMSAGQAFMDFKVGARLFRKNPLPNDVTPCVLIVDDNPFNIAVAGHLVLRQGYQAKTALYGQVAINLALNNNHEKEPIVLILMDLQMPLMDGYETTRQLKKMMKEKKIPEIPIVSLSANDSETDINACKKVGMCDHLSKPLKESELIRILQKYDTLGSNS